jgi:hypothetical protein
MNGDNRVHTLATSSPAKEGRYSLDSKLSSIQANTESKEEDRISDPLLTFMGPCIVIYFCSKIN